MRCDIDSSGGYCTVSPCEPGTCPASSVCAIFPNRQSFCMARCVEDDDCRTNYYCDESEEHALAPFCRQGSPQ